MRTPPTSSLRLLSIDSALAERLCGAAPLDIDRAHDFPQQGDLAVCSLVADGTLPLEAPWCAYAVIVDDTIVGTAGFKGTPADGSVEIGYGIVPSRQRQGLGTRAVVELLDIARDEGARCVTAETESGNVASRALLRGLGFAPTDDLWWAIAL